MIELAEYLKVSDYTERHMLEALCLAEPVGRLEPSAWWTEEGLDWGEKEDFTPSPARAGQVRAAQRG